MFRLKRIQNDDQFNEKYPIGNKDQASALI